VELASRTAVGNMEDAKEVRFASRGYIAVIEALAFSARGALSRPAFVIASCTSGVAAGGVVPRVYSALASLTNLLLSIWFAIVPWVPN
jgi:hypothetical protein